CFSDFPTHRALDGATQCFRPETLGLPGFHAPKTHPPGFLKLLDMLCYLKYHFTMEITIDKAGRVVIPKAYRSRFHFDPGTRIELIAENDSLKLRLPETRATFRDKNGVLVQCADPSSTVDATAVMNRLREARSLETTEFPSER
ncbi:MAG: AbrB/MazE/SpoVT family DNA-binding domain-containing protein, partial [Opitutales bacterium]